VLELTGEADASCPAMPEAYARAGQVRRALNAYEQCADAAPGDPERWLDLAAAYAAADRPAGAERALSHARELDPQHPYFSRVAEADRQGRRAHDEERP
jgi:Flp pilus assembly protein TadD